MALPASDDFAGGAAALSGSWTQQRTVTLNRDGSGAAVSSSGSDEGFVRWNADTFYNAQYSKAIIASGLGSGTGYAQVTVRNSTDTGDSAWDGYILYTDGVNGAGHTELSKATNGTQAVLRNYSPAAAFTAGDMMELHAIGGVLYAFKNGVSIGTHSDATYSTGYAGCGAFGTAKLASWEGGNSGITLATGLGLATLNGFPPSISTTGADSAALSGTVTASITEDDIVAGGKTIILTLTGATWVPNA